jgi:guanosine-3',5'-bis(diphosphate) 3'-pyrophosphohydrolase
MRPDETTEAFLLRAAAFAAEQHREQRRKDSDSTPYINHPLQVAETLAKVGAVTDPYLLAAALLHDVVEDTDVTFEQLEAEFGPVVRGYVAEVTDDKNLPKLERKRLQIAEAPTRSEGAAQIKLADKICNVRDLGCRRPAGWPLTRVTEYFAWAERVIDALPRCNPALEARFREAVAQSRSDVSGGDG